MAGPSKTYTQTIYEQLRHEIVSGVLRPGDRLTEQEIAQRMGSSHGPVREALAQLRALGLIIALPHRGTFVSEISQEDARDIYEIRVVLEREAVRRALPRMTDEDVIDLRERLDRLVVAAGTENASDIIAADMEYHRKFFEVADSKTLLNFWNMIETRTRKFIAVVSPRVFQDQVAVARTHEQLTDLAEARDLKGLDEALEGHIMRVWNQLASEAE